jgi:AdoMet-dependent rRNA methyltransferase SPB1
MSSHKAHVLKRREKFYHLAKQQGLRSRAAYKLIQLNKKFNFLSNSKACLDLCAAPGGWLQICSKYMPVSSLIIGIDILPIKPLPNVITLVEDITTQSCRAAIKKQLQGWQVDLVLHDGAPNVGGGGMWAKDAYIQVELVLHSLKLATEFLCEGGTFVTKVFRSADYMALTWVLKQFFRRVDVTRPPASRQVSAEIFAVCQGYLAPKKIDPKLFDPAVVFRPTTLESDAQQAAKSATSLFGQQRNARPNRSGYATDKQVLFETVPVSEFINAANPTPVLARANALVWDDESEVYRAHKATTTDILELLKDIKVLGTSDFSQLMRWHKKLHKFKAELEYAAATAEAADAAAAGAADAADDDDDVEIDDGTGATAGAADDSEDIDGELDELSSKLERRKKLEKKKKHEAKMKELRRLALNANTHKDADANMDETLFELRKLGNDDTAKLVRQQGRAINDSAGATIGGIRADKFNRIISTNHLEGHMELSSDDSGPSEEDNGANDDSEISDSERRVRAMERSVNYLYAEYQKRRNVVAKQKRRELGLEGDGEAPATTKSAKGPVKASGSDDDDAETASDDDEDQRHDALSRARMQVAGSKAKLAQLTEGGDSASARAQRWFSQGAFNDVELGLSDDDDDDDEEESDDGLSVVRRKADLARAQAALSRHTAAAARAQSGSAAAKAALAGAGAGAGAAPRGKRARAAEPAAGADADAEDDEESSDDDSSDSDDEASRQRWLGHEEEAAKQDAKRRKAMAAAEAARGNGGNIEEVPISDYSDDSDARAEILAMGTKMLRKKTRNAIIDSAYNRYAFNDHSTLPDWFVDEENRHNKAQLPVTKAEVDLIKAQLKEIDARSIRKIAESKARKKKKAIRKMERAKLEANTIIGQEGVSADEKMKQIEKLYKSTRAKQKLKPTKQYVVTSSAGNTHDARNKKKGGNGKPFTVRVDNRMKADKRGRDRAEWRNKNKKRR